jgi:phosphoenolpyruvate carboxylase
MFKTSLELDDSALDEAGRLAFLGEAFAKPEGIVHDLQALPAPTRETLQVFDVMARMRREIGLLDIGSRPSHRRKQDRSKQSVRAVAWVFALAQPQQTFPAWYGIGSALESWCAGSAARLERLNTLYRDWSFFRNLLSNARMALCKSDMSIARAYAICAATWMPRRGSMG